MSTSIAVAQSAPCRSSTARRAPDEINAVVAGGATFTLFDSLLGGLLMTAMLYGGARWATQHDPQFLRIVLRAATSRRRYDPGQFAHVTVRRRTR